MARSCWADQFHYPGHLTLCDAVQGLTLPPEQISVILCIFLIQFLHSKSLICPNFDVPAYTETSESLESTLTPSISLSPFDIGTANSDPKFKARVGDIRKVSAARRPNLHILSCERHFAPKRSLVPIACKLTPKTDAKRKAIFESFPWRRYCQEFLFGAFLRLFTRL